MYQHGSTGQIYVEFDTGDFYEKFRETPNLVKIGQEYLELYTKT